MSTFTTKSFPFDGPMIISGSSAADNMAFLSNPEMQDEYSQMGIEESLTHHTTQSQPRGTIRGLYFQRKDPLAQLVAVTEGSILLVVVDMKPESKTFGASHAVELSAENGLMVYIPQYFAMGFLTLDYKNQIVVNYTKPYMEENNSGIVWDDEILAIDWRFERYDIDAKRLNISMKDRKLPSFRSYSQHELWPNRSLKRTYALKRLLNQRG